MVVSGSHFALGVSEPLSQQPPTPCSTAGVFPPLVSVGCLVPRLRLGLWASGQAHYSGSDYKTVAKKAMTGLVGVLGMCGNAGGQAAHALSSGAQIPGGLCSLGREFSSGCACPGNWTGGKAAVMRPLRCYYGDGVGASCLQPEFSAWQL